MNGGYSPLRRFIRDERARLRQGLIGLRPHRAAIEAWYPGGIDAFERETLLRSGGLRRRYTPEQLALYEHMAYLSQEYWCAGWLNDLDVACQSAIDLGNVTPNGKYQAFSPRDFEELVRRRRAAGGWWVWDDSVGFAGPGGDSVTFIPDV